jgi:hypothetical protein
MRIRQIHIRCLEDTDGRSAESVPVRHGRATRRGSGPTVDTHSAGRTDGHRSMRGCLPARRAAVRGTGRVSHVVRTRRDHRRSPGYDAAGQGAAWRRHPAGTRGECHPVRVDRVPDAPRPAVRRPRAQGPQRPSHHGRAAPPVLGSRPSRLGCDADPRARISGRQRVGTVEDRRGHHVPCRGRCSVAAAAPDPRRQAAPAGAPGTAPASG